MIANTPFEAAEKVERLGFWEAVEGDLRAAGNRPISSPVDPPWYVLMYYVIALEERVRELEARK